MLAIKLKTKHYNEKQKERGESFHYVTPITETLRTYGGNDTAESITRKRAVSVTVSASLRCRCVLETVRFRSNDWPTRLGCNAAKAKAAYQDFLTLWKDADPDIPILIAAKAEYAKLK
jgi:hypothetical protein